MTGIALSLLGTTFASAITGPSYIGGAIVNANATVSYPAGTQVGDLAIAIVHNFTAYTPTGYTTAFTTTADVNNYLKRVSYRVIQSGDTSVQLNNDTIGFDSTLIVIRGRTSVSSTYTWDYGSGGGSKNLSVAVNGTLIAVASDRGATGYPTISGITFDQTNTGTATYFYQRNSIKLDYTSGASVTFTDFNDVYGTSFLMLVAT